MHKCVSCRHSLLPQLRPNNIFCSKLLFPSLTTLMKHSSFNFSGFAWKICLLPLLPSPQFFWKAHASEGRAVCIWKKLLFSVTNLRHGNNLCGRTSGGLKIKMGFDLSELWSSENSIQRCLLYARFPVSSHCVHLRSAELGLHVKPI